MIFKTIKDDATKSGEAITFLGKKISDIKSDFKNHKGIITSLFKSENFGVSDKQTAILKDWNKAIDEGNLSKKEQTKILKNADEATQKYFQGLNGGKATLDGLAKATGKVSVGAKAAAAGMGLLKTAFNTVAYFAIVQAASAVLNLIITKIDEVVNRTQKIKEAATEAKTVIKDIKSEFDNLKSSTEDIGKKFAELAQGVENLGKTNQSRGKLNVEDYDEFLDLSNQLAELYPQLTKGFDDNGNAILNLSGNVNTITQSLENLLSVQQKIANQQILEKLPDVWAGYNVNLNEYTKSLGLAELRANTALKMKDDLSQGKTFLSTRSNTGSYLVMERAIKNLKFDDLIYSEQGNIYDSDLVNRQLLYTNYVWNLNKLTDTQIEQLKNELARLASEYQNSADYVKSQISSANSEMSSYINSWLFNEWNYLQLDTPFQNVIQDILINSDWIKSLPSNIDSGNWNEVSNWINQNLLYAIQKIDSEETKQSLSNAINDILSIEEIQSLIETLKTNKGFDSKNPIIVYLQTKVDTKNERIENAKSRIQDEYKDRVIELSDEDLQIASEKITVSDGDLLSWDELKSKIEEAKITSDTAVDSFDNISEKIAQIQENASDTVANVKIFNDAIDKVNNGENLSYDEVSELLKLDPSLASNFTKTVDGYSIAVDELIAANDRIKGVSSSNIELEIDDTTQNIADNEARIKKLTEERQKLYAEINANKDNDHYNGNETYERLLDIDEEIETLTNSIKNGQDLLSVLQLTLGEISESTSTIQQVSLSDLSSSYELLNSVSEEINENGTINLSTLQKIKDTYPKLKSVIDNYLSGIINENELISELSNAYKTDEDNYYKYLLLKLGYDEDFIKSAYEGNDNIVDY